MANDLATLRTRLAVTLRDAGMETWESDELDDILASATAQLYPRVARPMSLPIYPLVDAQEDYDLPAGILEVSRVDIANVDTDTLLFHAGHGSWEVNGDPLTGAGELFINSAYSNPDHYLVVHGYGAYDLVTALPPDIYVPFIMATARAEAWRAMLSSRARFEKWLTLNQKENVSVNEISQMIAQAEGEAERQRERMKTWRKPKPA